HGAERAGNRFRLAVGGRGGGVEIEAHAVVDASGDAACLALLGAPTDLAGAESLQRPALVCALGGVADGALSETRRLAVLHSIASAVRAGTLSQGALGATFRAAHRPGEAFLTLNLDGPADRAYDPLDPACLRELELAGRALA